MEKLYDFMETDEEIGQLMPKVLDPSGSLQHLCKLLPSPCNLVMRRFLSFMKKRLAKSNYNYEMRFSDYNSVMNVPFLSGCFMFFRTATLKQVGFFDERLFLYTEDTDLTRRMHRYNKTVFFPDAAIYHHHAKGSYKEPKLLWHNIKSTITYFNKWGWMNDTEREIINRRATLQYSSNLNPSHTNGPVIQDNKVDLLSEHYEVEQILSDSK
ncbi:MAG: glycosyltransferase [Bacteroidota bacterium]